MATIPRSYVDGYADSLETLSSAMKERLADALVRVDYAQPVDVVRDQLVAIMQRWCGASASVASELAATFYQGLRDRMVGGGFEALVTTGGYSDRAVERFVRAAVQPLADEGPEASDRVEPAMLERLGYEVKRAAGQTILDNGRRDPKRVRYARVPRGSRSYPGGCPFCRMLASRGFVYRSAKTAGADDPDHYHDNCQCMVVPGFGDDPKVEGYDPHDYDEGYADWASRDHSEHEANVAAQQRNRYDAQGRLKSGTGERLDQRRGERRKGVDSTSHGEATTSPLAQIESMEELKKTLRDRYSANVSESVMGLDFESVRGVACGIDDALAAVGAQEHATFSLYAADLGRKTFAQVTGTRVTLNTRFFGSRFELSVSTGHHEGAHVIERLLAAGDVESQEFGVHANSILNRALRAYNRNHPEARTSLDHAMRAISVYPSQVVTKMPTSTAAQRRRKQGTLMSERLACCFEDALGGSPVSEFSSYVIDATRRGFE